MKKAMAPHSSTLAWKIPWRRSLVGCSPWGREESDTTERLHFHFSLSRIREGNGNPLQCSCLENPGKGEPGGLPSMGSHRVGHDWSDLAAAAAKHTWAQEKVLEFKFKLHHWFEILGHWLILHAAQGPHLQNGNDRFVSLISWRHHRQKWLHEMLLLHCLAPASQAVHNRYYIIVNFRSLFSALILCLISTNAYWLSAVLQTSSHWALGYRGRQAVTW